MPSVRQLRESASQAVGSKAGEKGKGNQSTLRRTFRSKAEQGSVVEQRLPLQRQRLPLPQTVRAHCDECLTWCLFFLSLSIPTPCPAQTPNTQTHANTKRAKIVFVQLQQLNAINLLLFKVWSVRAEIFRGEPYHHVGHAELGTKRRTLLQKADFGEFMYTN